MSESPNVGFILSTLLPPERVAQAASAVEAAGFDELWLAEDCFFAGGIASAAAALNATSHIPVGVGLFSCMLRHPAVLAMEISALCRTHAGRFRPGLGLGLSAFLEQLGLMPKSPLRAVREAVTTLRALVLGDRLTDTTGTFSFSEVELAFHVTPPDPVINVGAMGPNMLRLAGEVGDGAILSVLAHRRYVSWAAERVNEGAERLEGRPTRRITVFALFFAHEDRDVARSEARKLLAPFLALLSETELVRSAGISAQLSILRQGGDEHLWAAIPDEWLDEFTVCGTPEDCAGRIRSLHAAGADAVALLPPADIVFESINIAGERILPLLGERANS